MALRLRRSRRALTYFEGKSNVFAIFINGVNYFLSRLGAVMCMGVTAGAYVLTLFAVCTLFSFEGKNTEKYSEGITSNENQEIKQLHPR